VTAVPDVAIVSCVSPDGVTGWLVSLSSMRAFVYADARGGVRILDGTDDAGSTGAAVRAADLPPNIQRLLASVVNAVRYRPLD
jgi:hypothetical protein